MNPLLAMAQKFEVEPSPTIFPDVIQTPPKTVTLEIRSKDGKQWAISAFGSVLNNRGEWEQEPLPSRRTDDFLSRCRYTLRGALIAIGRDDLVPHLYETLAPPIVQGVE